MKYQKANSSSKIRVAGLLASSAICALPAVVQAQDTQDSVFVLEEIMVTAQKRTQSSQDIGLAVTAVSGEKLKELGISDSEELLNFVPGTGFFDITGGGVPVIIIRGVGLQNFRINDTPTTAMYVDEIYQTSVAEAVASFFDLERVEVLKGPQGGLYGRNAVGGAIQVISAKPDFDEFTGYGLLDYGSYGRVSTEAALSGPLSDTLAFRLSGRLISSGDTYFHSVPGNFDHGEEERWGVRGQLAYRPSDTLEFLLKVHGGGDQSETPLLRAIGVYERQGLGLGSALGIGNTADGAILNVGNVGRSLNNVCSSILQGSRSSSSCETINGQTEDELGLSSVHDSDSLLHPAIDNEWWGISLVAKVSLGDFELTSVTAYDDFDHKRIVSFDAVSTIQQDIDYDTRIEAFSQELRLAYDAGGSATWLMGANYATDQLVEDSSLMALTGLLPFALGGLTAAGQEYDQETTALAAYGRFEVALSDQLKLVSEARYTHEEKEFAGGVELTQIGVDLTFTDDEVTFNALTGKIGFEYKPHDDLLLYANVSRGFKSGGFFGGFATAQAQLAPFDKEKITAYELGFKSDNRDMNLRLNGSVFYYDRQDVQASGIDTSGVVNISRLTNIGDAKTYGAELEAVWQPHQNFSLQAAAAYVDAKITSSDKGTSDIFFSTTIATFEDARFPNQPKFSSNIIAVYENDISADLLGSFSVEYSYRSNHDLKIVVVPEESAVVTEDGFSLVNLRASISSHEAGWELSAYVTNLFDTEYRTTAIVGGPGGAYEIYGAPRIWGVRLGYSF